MEAIAKSKARDLFDKLASWVGAAMRSFRVSDDPDKPPWPEKRRNRRADGLT